MFRPKLESLEDRSVPATIAGTVWADADGDGVQDAGEGVYAGALTVYLYDQDNLDVPIDYAPLVNGQYSFVGVQPGNYQLRFSVPAGHTLSPWGQDSDFTLFPGGSTAFEFAYVGSVGDYLYRDAGLVPPGGGGA